MKKKREGVVETPIGTIVLRQGKAHPGDAKIVDEVLYITPEGVRHVVDRGGQDVTEIWDVIRECSKTPKRSSR